MDVEPWKNTPFESPREWQMEARARAVQSISDRNRSVIQAIMGAGKSAVIGELAYTFLSELASDSQMVVTTPKIMLVEQLYETITSRVPESVVGRYYSHAKESASKIVVACIDSTPRLATEIEGSPYLWIADEAHRTECDTMHAAYQMLEPISVLGFTATPYRASDFEELSFFDEQIFQYTASNAIQDGIVVEPEVIQWDGHKCTVDDASLEMIAEHTTPEMPGMVNSLTTDSADSFANKLRDYGIAADSIHSRKSPAQNDEVISRLKSGDLRCAVHVDMLSEGADFPFLEWLCLRRNTGSRVRFAQEVGRVLRTYPGKEKALILDPRDLFGRFEMHYEAVLNGDAIESDAGAIDVIESYMSDGEGSYLPAPDYAQALDASTAWLRQTKIAMQNHGYIEDVVDSTHWRDDDISESQVKALRNIDFVRQYVPERYRAMYDFAANRCVEGEYRKGEASDLLSILFAVIENDYSWPELEE